MAKIVFTDTWLQSPKSIGEWYDEACTGLVIVRGKKGGGAWYVRTRTTDGKYGREPLGRYPEVSLAEARRAVTTWDKRPSLSVGGGKPVKTHTIGSLLDLYESTRHGELKRLDARMRVLRNGFKDYLAMPFADFGENEMRASHGRMSDGGRGVNGNRFLAYACAWFKWIEKVPHIGDVTNWTRKVRRVKEKPRSRVLSMDELGLIWRATLRMGPLPVRISYGKLVRLLMLTGQRLNDVAELRHGHILDGIWTQTFNKSDRRHQVPLTEAAKAEIGQGTARDIVVSKNGRVWNNFDRYLRELRTMVGAEEHWTQHDLRRSMATHMGTLGIAPFIIDAMLNHAPEKVSGTYNWAQYLPEKRAALELWTNALMAAANGERVAA